MIARVGSHEWFITAGDDDSVCCELGISILDTTLQIVVMDPKDICYCWRFLASKVDIEYLMHQ